MLLVNFNLANTCARMRPRCALLCVQLRTCELACLAELILAILVKNLPIRQIKIPAKVSGYTVCETEITTSCPYLENNIYPHVTIETRVKWKI